MIQSAASRAKSIGMATIGMRAASQQVPIVEIGDTACAVGSGSWNRSEPRNIRVLDSTELTELDLSQLFVDLPEQKARQWKDRLERYVR
jgi:hypothetical protein